MFLEKLEKLKKDPNDLILLIAAVIGIIILLTINILIFEPLFFSVIEYGILDFEFAWTREQILTIFTAWGAEGMALQAAAVYWDFLFIVGYTVPLFALILLVSRKLNEEILNIGLYMSLTPIIAGIFDIIENINLLIMLHDPLAFASFVPLVASLSATIKFGFLIVGAIFLIVALILLVIKKFKK